MEAWDAVIAGGGPAGSAAAILLSRAGWNVAVLEKRRFPREKVCGEYLSATNWPLLDILGVAEEVRAAAGPAVVRAGVFAGESRIEAPLPAVPPHGFGRALGREQLDAILLAAARRSGASVLQPFAAASCERAGDRWRIRAAAAEADGPLELAAPVFIAAHGSWEPGALATLPHRVSPRPGDLLAFKGRFRGGRLPAGLMPLVCFDGGYGGLVHSDGGRFSFSCCVRRDRLARIERRAGARAGDAVLAHVLATCPAARQVFDGAEIDGEWLSAGPIRPGIRRRHADGIFAAGNAAGEAHPAIAEGIAMALQSAWLLARNLLSRPGVRVAAEVRRAAGKEYAAAWLDAFAPRIRWASAVAHWAMRPMAAGACVPVLRRFPSLLGAAARWSGKARVVVR